MWEFNLVATMASDARFRRLVADLKRLGDFRRTEFLGVLVGRVEDRIAFLETLRAEREKRLTAFQDLGRIIPIDRVFVFTPENFVGLLRQSVVPYLDQLAGRRFYVRLERRGHKGEIVSPEAERAVDAFIEENLLLRRAPATIDFENPEAVVAVETIGDRAGIGLLTRETMDRYDFVRIG